jgi:hypothetical protein
MKILFLHTSKFTMGDTTSQAMQISASFARQIRNKYLLLSSQGAVTKKLRRKHSKLSLNWNSVEVEMKLCYR